MISKTQLDKKWKCTTTSRILQHQWHAKQAGGFYGPIAPPVLNAPSLWICGQDPRNDAGATFLDPHIVDSGFQHAAAHWRCTPLPASAYHSIGGRLPEWLTSKCISSVSFVRIKSNFFNNTQETQTQTNDGTILKFEFCDFWEFFWHFQKASRGPSAADLDHYGRGKTRSE